MLTASQLDAVEAEQLEADKRTLADVVAINNTLRQTLQSFPPPLPVLPPASAALPPTSAAFNTNGSLYSATSHEKSGSESSDSSGGKTTDDPNPNHG